MRYTRGSDLHERAFRYLWLLILKDIINNRWLKYILRGLLLLQINRGEERLQILQMPFLNRCWAVKWIQKRGWSLQVCLEIVLIDLIYFFSNEYLLKHFMRINLPEDIALLFIAFSVIFKWNFKIQNGDYLGQYIW